MLTTPSVSTATLTGGRPIRSLSCVWICDDDRDDWRSTLDRYVAAIRSQPVPAGLIVVNNGLGPLMSGRLRAALGQCGLPATIVSTTAPCAASVAMSTAFKRVTGDVVVILPSYLQADPRDIAEMLRAVRGGLDYVGSWRRPRIDSGADQSKSRLFNSIVSWSSGVLLHDINSGLRVMRREVLQYIPTYGDLHLYLPIMAARQGFAVGEVAVRHLEERPGKAGSGMGIYLRRGLDLLTLFFLIRFTQKPFRFFGGIGSGLLAAGGLINLVLATQRIFWQQPLAERPMLVLGTLLMVLGIQMFSLGLIGELIIFVNAGGIADYQIEQVFECPDTREADS
jgi:hypothetical protein